MEEKIAELADVKQLEGFTYIGLVDQYAKAYGKLPRQVNAERFDDFMPLLIFWRKQNNFDKRYAIAERKLNK